MISRIWTPCSRLKRFVDPQSFPLIGRVTSCSLTLYNASNDVEIVGDDGDAVERAEVKLRNVTELNVCHNTRT